ncbi:MAG: Flp pilus assembly complex ATPase component TadA, partial [Candidatus Gastranaerophilales bacterium]|nr:Flp pilus assembly complex ATPase component TadA [Candidatus Gastranaerophilales bacterium]
EEALLTFIEDNLHIPYVNLESYKLDEKCLSLISAEDAYKYRILPLFRIENVLRIAMADPLDLFALNNVIKCMQCDIEPVICSEDLVLQNIKKYYSRQDASKLATEHGKGLIIDWREELNEEFPDMSQAKRIINSIISQALLEGVFEIIFESTGSGLSVKFRKAGVRKAGEMHEKGEIPLLLSPLCIAQVKELSKLDPSVSDIPLLGKFSFPADVDNVTGVVSTFPTTKGERITIRLYHPPQTINEIKITEEERKIILNAVEKPGFILITGGELSGKSFIAYSLLNSLNSQEKNIMTIESVVKYELKGGIQCELNEKVGFNAEKALKMVDFQSPDVLYVEEIDADNLLKLAGSGKLIIAEMTVPNITEELKKVVNCIISIKNTGETVVSIHCE